VAARATVIGDDRFVPADDPLNNMGMARQTFLDLCRRCPVTDSYR